MRNMRIKAAAVILAAGGLGFGLMGTGVHAAFTDSGSAQANISVGTMGIVVSSSTPGAVVVNGGNGVHTVTLTAPALQSSAAGSLPIQFSIALASGSMPVYVTVTKGAAPASPFSDMLAANVPSTLVTSSTPLSVNGGIQWTVLGNANEGQVASVTYTIQATA